MEARRGKFLFFLLFIAIVIIPEGDVSAQSGKKPGSFLPDQGNLQSLFRYKKGNDILVSGHRGGREPGFPENSLEGFQNVLSQMPAIFEIDPRLTKDSVIVLMHDETLDRTTTGKGRLKDYTWDEIKKFRLKDSDGNVTDSSIPTLEEVIAWSIGKTVVNLDRKDVPIEMTAALIETLHAEKQVMLTVHNGHQAKFHHDCFPDIMLSAFVRNRKEYEDMSASGVPWKNIIAYVGPSITPENSEIVELLHKKKVRCMISVAPTHDKLKTVAERKKAYQEEIRKKPDIIESDIPTEIWNALHSK
jgi:glycerophosphoryl diester phosphodiesterase